MTFFLRSDISRPRGEFSESAVRCCHLPMLQGTASRSAGHQPIRVHSFSSRPVVASQSALSRRLLKQEQWFCRRWPAQPPTPSHERQNASHFAFARRSGNLIKQSTNERSASLVCTLALNIHYGPMLLSRRSPKERPLVLAPRRRSKPKLGRDTQGSIMHVRLCRSMAD